MKFIFNLLFWTVYARSSNASARQRCCLHLLIRHFRSPLLLPSPSHILLPSLYFYLHIYNTRGLEKMTFWIFFDFFINRAGGWRRRWTRGTRLEKTTSPARTNFVQNLAGENKFRTSLECPAWDLEGRSGRKRERKQIMSERTDYEWERESGLGMRERERGERTTLRMSERERNDKETLIGLFIINFKSNILLYCCGFGWKSQQ